MGQTRVFYCQLAKTHFQRKWLRSNSFIPTSSFWSNNAGETVCRHGVLSLVRHLYCSGNYHRGGFDYTSRCLYVCLWTDFVTMIVSQQCTMHRCVAEIKLKAWCKWENSLRVFLFFSFLGWTFKCMRNIWWLTPFSMLPVWHRVPSAAGILFVTQRLLLLRHQSSLHTS